MKVGDVVVRNPEYNWCVCQSWRTCWCRAKGVRLTIVKTDSSRNSQSGLMVAVTDGRNTSDLLDSSHFVEVDRGQLVRQAEDAKASKEQKQAGTALPDGPVAEESRSSK